MSLMFDNLMFTTLLTTVYYRIKSGKYRETSQKHAFLCNGLQKYSIEGKVSLTLENKLLCEM